MNCLPEPVPKAEITNCGSGSFLFTTDLKKFYRKKILVAEEVFVNCYNFNPITQVKFLSPLDVSSC
jgi:hypothetical protein